MATVAPTTVGAVPLGPGRRFMSLAPPPSPDSTFGPPTGAPPSSELQSRRSNRLMAAATASARRPPPYSTLNLNARARVATMRRSTATGPPSPSPSPLPSTLSLPAPLTYLAPPPESSLRSLYSNASYPSRRDRIVPLATAPRTAWIGRGESLLFFRPPPPPPRPAESRTALAATRIGPLSLPEDPPPSPGLDGQRARAAVTAAAATSKISLGDPPTSSLLSFRMMQSPPLSLGSGGGRWGGGLPAPPPLCIASSTRTPWNRRGR